MDNGTHNKRGRRRRRSRAIVSVLPQNKQLYCAALAVSTGQRCKNVAVHFVPYAIAVIDLVTCCWLCTVHNKIVESKLKPLVLFGGLEILKIIASDMSGMKKSDICMSVKASPPPEMNYFKPPWNIYGKKIISNFKSICAS